MCEGEKERHTRKEKRKKEPKETNISQPHAIPNQRGRSPEMDCTRVVITKKKKKAYWHVEGLHLTFLSRNKDREGEVALKSQYIRACVFRAAVHGCSLLRCK